jgi:hypothetical protein
MIVGKEHCGAQLDILLSSNSESSHVSNVPAKTTVDLEECNFSMKLS